MALREEFTKTGEWLFRWRGYFPLIILPLMLFAMKDTRSLEALYGKTAAVIWDGFCLIVSISGLLVRCITIAYVPRETSGRNTKKGQVANCLNVTGMYSIVRHPLYLGNFLIFMGMVLFIHAVWLIIFTTLIFFIYYERIMFAEEEFLRKKFSEQFLIWADRTPAFIPRFKRWRSAELKFSFKNILKREYSAMFLIGSIFPLIANLRGIFIEGKKELDTFWSIFFISSIIIYLILRTIKKKTSILEVEGR